MLRGCHHHAASQKELLVQVIIEGGKASASASGDKSGTGLDALYEALAKTHVENAKASKPEDRETVLAMLEEKDQVCHDEY